MTKNNIYNLDSPVPGDISNEEYIAAEEAYISESLKDLMPLLSRARLLAESIPEDHEEWSEGNSEVQGMLDYEWSNDSDVFYSLRIIYTKNQMTPPQKSHYEETVAILRKHKPLLEKMEFYIPDVIQES